MKFGGSRRSDRGRVLSGGLHPSTAHFDGRQSERGPRPGHLWRATDCPAPSGLGRSRCRPRRARWSRGRPWDCHQPTAFRKTLLAIAIARRRADDRTARAAAPGLQLDKLPSKLTLPTCCFAVAAERCAVVPPRVGGAVSLQDRDSFAVAHEARHVRRREDRSRRPTRWS